MAQTRLDYNGLMFGTSDTTYKYKDATITGLADLVAGQVVVLDTGKYRAAIDADKALIVAGYRILLVDAAVSGGDVIAPTGTRGGIFEDKLVGAGLAVDDRLINLLASDNIEVITGTDSIQVAGEDA